MPTKYKKIYPMYANWFVIPVPAKKAKIVKGWYEVDWDIRSESEVFESKTEYIEWIKDYMQCLMDNIE